MLKIVCVCGARPNFMKIAPIVDALAKSGAVETYLVHTGQHYDEKMSDLFFGELGIPEPDLNLEVGSGSHASQTAEIMKRFEPVCLEQKPDWLIVVGDVNSTIACALVACKLGIKVAHVEAGLRSFDREMPEEINRLLTDAISDVLFVTEQSGIDNLKNEGVADEKVHFVGNVMIDTLLRSKGKAESSTVLETLGLAPKSYAAMTLHRPSNVDEEETLAGILTAIEKIAADMPVVFPVHPRSRKTLTSPRFAEWTAKMPNLKMIDPLGYLDFMKLTASAALVLTDSGGIQEETTILGVPCLTLRENTERPVTITEGTNTLVGVETEAILQAYAKVRKGEGNRGTVPRYWDGKAADRIAKILVESQVPAPQAVGSA